MFGLKLLLIASCLTVPILAVDLTNLITLCERSSPTTSECIKDNLNNIMKDLVHGSSEYGIPVLDPLYVQKALNQDTSGSVRIDFYNFTYSGLAQNNISQVKATFDKKCQIRIKSIQPVTVITGRYTGGGRLLLFQIQGSGKFEIVLNNMDLLTVFDCEIYQKDNEEYMRIKDIHLTIRPASGSMFFEDIVQNNKELSKTMNEILNENYHDMIKEYSPPILRGIEAGYTRVSDGLVKDIPLKMLFKS